MLSAATAEEVVEPAETRAGAAEAGNERDSELICGHDSKEGASVA